ncbi:unnamed protein product [Prorocentrum cordatum]|uniref:RING-type E3 ubiquitin transferase n=1 Tax=Prorocentrum cordatum TaxID=2364126 RepID=A0ABN9U2V0_9DINO|nr:unnamed protein product [Polarella glacialis]
MELTGVLDSIAASSLCASDRRFAIRAAIIEFSANTDRRAEEDPVVIQEAILKSLECSRIQDAKVRLRNGGHHALSNRLGLLSRKRNAAAHPKLSSLLSEIIAITPTPPKQETDDVCGEEMAAEPIDSSEGEITDTATCTQLTSAEEELSGPTPNLVIDVVASTECSLSQTHMTDSRLAEDYLSQHPAAVLQGSAVDVVRSMPEDGPGSSTMLATDVEKLFLDAFAVLSPGRKALCAHWLLPLAIYLKPSLSDDPSGMIQYIISDKPMGAIEELKSRLGVSSTRVASQGAHVHECSSADLTGGMQPAEDKVLLCEEYFHFNCPALHGLRERTSLLSGRYCCDYC